MQWPDNINIWVGGRYETIRGKFFTIILGGEEHGFAAHPSWPNGDEITITECRTGLRIAYLESRYAMFPECVVSACKDKLFEIRCDKGDTHIMDAISREMAKRNNDDDIPF